MRISLADAFARIQSKQAAPVLLVDTCNFLDLFRTDEGPSKLPCLPRVESDDIQAAASLRALRTATPDAVHLLVPELVPREYADHAAVIQDQFARWTERHDLYQKWLLEVGKSVAVALPVPHPVHPVDLAARLRTLADDLLSQALVLERNVACVDRAIDRLINKIRPSHRKEIKDSMNLEQCLELSRRLGSAGFARSRVWVSSNTRDFALPNGVAVHPDLAADFAASGLKYFPSLRVALGYLHSSGEL